MTTAADQANFPTMIIPRGTEIRVNHHGQLSIKTPGNLVIQNSGTYSEIESTNGSIRIEENVSVEAVSVRAGQGCFIQGTLTAWKVHAKRITLEDRAKAFIMLQESDHLELSKTARLVGNFASEKELYLMMGKFTGQLKELPSAVDLTANPAVTETRAYTAISTTSPAAPPTQSASHPTQIQRGDDERLRTAQTLLEREVARNDLGAAELEALREILFGLRERNMQRVSSVYRDAFAEMRNPSEGLRMAYEQLQQYFAAHK